MTTMFHRHPYQFEAVQWTGDNLVEVRDFTGTRVRPYDGTNMYIFHPIGTYLPDYLYDDRDPKPTAELWTGPKDKWQPVTVGEWILPNDGEFHTATDEFMKINFVELTPEMKALIEEDERPKTFLEDLTRLVNHHSMESVSGTPDFILAMYLHRCLETYDAIITARADWRGESVELLALQTLPKGQQSLIVQEDK